VKGILNSYQAEYAGNGGAVVEVVTKSGGREYHGSMYYFGRNEDLNANDFFNNRNGVKRPEYRYNTSERLWETPFTSRATGTATATSSSVSTTWNRSPTAFPVR
jgi:hypothetical protein